MVPLTSSLVSGDSNYRNTRQHGPVNSLGERSGLVGHAAAVGSA